MEMVNVSFGGFGCHTNKERINVDELQQLSEYLALLFML
jgi:di/tripeptidase